MEESESFEQHWLLSSSIQRVKYLKLLSAYPKTTWTEEEKKVFLWLCQMDRISIHLKQWRSFLAN